MSRPVALLDALFIGSGLAGGLYQSGHSVPLGLCLMVGVLAASAIDVCRVLLTERQQ